MFKFYDIFFNNTIWITTINYPHNIIICIHASDFYEQNSSPEDVIIVVPFIKKQKTHTNSITLMKPNLNLCEWNY